MTVAHRRPEWRRPEAVVAMRKAVASVDPVVEVAAGVAVSVEVVVEVADLVDPVAQAADPVAQAVIASPR